MQDRQVTRAARLASSLRQLRRRGSRSIKIGVRQRIATYKRWRSKARFILVTGSSGKTTTVSLLHHILAAEHRVASQSLRNSLNDATNLLRRLKGDEDFVVLEAGTTGPGDIAAIAAHFRPDVSVVTLVAIEHYSAFRSLLAVTEEKGCAVTALASDGLAILNFQPPDVREMANRTQARIVSFGTDGGDYRASQITMNSEGRVKLVLSTPSGPLSLDTLLIGEHNWLSITAAATCALALGVEPHMVAARVSTFEPVEGRLSQHTLADGTTFLLDTVKAPFHSINLPITMLEKLDYRYKRVVIGQISDYAGNPTAKYRDTYLSARAVADEVIFVGPRSHKATPLKEDRETGRFHSFTSVRALSEHLRTTAVPGEVVLVKSASNLHLERLVLARQMRVECWADECGIKQPCRQCGRYSEPFSTHGSK